MSKIIYKFMDNELMRLMFSEVTDLTYVYDTQGNILFVNKIFEKFTGYRPEEFYGKPFATLFDSENLAKAKIVYKKTLQGESSQCELCFKTTGVVCEYKNFPLRDEHGTIIGVVGIARDITSRKQAEEGLVGFHRSLEKQVIDHSAKLREIHEELTEEVNSRKRLEREHNRSMVKLQKSLRGVMEVAALTIESKILGVADVVDAMTFSRPYRTANSLKGALEEISQKSGVLYDFNVVHACLTVFGEKGFKFEQWPVSNLRLFEDVLLRV